MGWATLGSIDVPGADESTITVSELDHILDELAAMSGPGSNTRRAEQLHRLLARAGDDDRAPAGHGPDLVRPRQGLTARLQVVLDVAADADTVGGDAELAKPLDISLVSSEDLRDRPKKR